MKKREPIKRKDNVILFPELEKRLAIKGLENLELKKFKEAIPLLEEARELDPDNHDALIGLVVAYFEAGAFQKAKDLANEILFKGIGDYFQMVDLYLTILIQLHEYQEIVTTIEALIEEKEIPSDKNDHFLTILQFSKRMAESHQKEEATIVEEEEELKNLNLFHLKDVNEQLLVVSALAEKNIRPYMAQIENYLESEEGNPFLQTMLLTILREQEINKEVTIQKLSKTIVVHPAELPEVREQPRMGEIKQLLKAKLEDHDPILFGNIMEMVERTFFISYPIVLEPDHSAAWASAFHLLAQSYFGMETNREGIALDYEVSSEELEQAIHQIEQIEKISYPNI